MKTIAKKFAVISVLTLMMSMVFTACSKEEPDYDEDIETVSETDDTSADDLNTDIDLDALNKSADNIKNLDLTSDNGNDSEPEEENKVNDESMDEPQGDKTVYSYTDVYRTGNDITVIPNGGLTGSTVLYSDKDINGFLDYVDSVVLEEGRTINRDLFYDILSIMLVDKDLSSDIGYIEKNMIMALAMANNFHDTDIDIKECYLDANNASDYVYKLTAFGKDDTWTVNYSKRTVLMNNGSTEYSSDMFKDEYLAAWMVAIEEYYGIK